MSNLVEHAKTELDSIGMTEDSSSQMDRDMRRHLLATIELFSSEGHSGSSASYAAAALERLLMFEPLGPLTGEESEWQYLDYGPEMKAQNKRCSHVFLREDGTAYDGEGIVFYDWMTDDDGKPYKCHYTGAGSRVEIEFPYTPTKEYRERIEE